MDFLQLRQAMVSDQLLKRGITDKKVLAALSKVPRHLFVPSRIRENAYDDCALPIGEGQTISQPYMVAVMTEKLGLKGSEKVLEIGTGSGYQAAILAELCQKVYTMERFAGLAKAAEKTLSELKYNNVEFIIADGTEGFPPAAPYDAILVTAGCPEIPQPLVKQLKNGGRLVIPVGDQYQQILTTIFKRGNAIEKEESVPCMFVPLVGKFGWNDSPG